MLVGETDDQARRHLRELEQAVHTLREFRAGIDQPARSIREDRFADRTTGEQVWYDDVLYLGLTKLSRSNPVLVGSPETIADAVLAYHELGFTVVSLGSHVTNERDAELRRETLRLIKQGVMLRDAAGSTREAA
jgi:alkanesulfonate monooxygenase SsuD/methylene tetrahydromethanopterin reductase-like flavin-dependent oxidoreductase (luciferase family)